MLDGAALGKSSARTLELRTTNGNFALHGADVEVKTPPRAGNTGASLTVVKLNAGDARLVTPQGGTILPTDNAQGFTAGKVTTDKVSLTDVAMTTSRTAPARTVDVVKDLPRAPLVPLTRVDPSFSPLTGPIFKPVPPPLIPPTLADRPVLVEAIKSEPAATDTSTSRFIVVDTSKTTTTRTTTPLITTTTRTLR
jgi:hypothetical protein